MIKSNKLAKKGIAFALPFLSLCFFFLIISIIALIFAVILKSSNDDDQRFTTMLSSSAILLDYARVTIETKPVADRMNDEQYMGSSPVPVERRLLDSVLGKTTSNCYLLDQLILDSNQFEGRSRIFIKKIGYSPEERSKSNCEKLGPTSVLILPNNLWVMSTSNGFANNPIPKVSLS